MNLTMSRVCILVCSLFSLNLFAQQNQASLNMGSIYPYSCVNECNNTYDEQEHEIFKDFMSNQLCIRQCVHHGLFSTEYYACMGDCAQDALDTSNQEQDRIRAERDQCTYGCLHRNPWDDTSSEPKNKNQDSMNSIDSQSGFGLN